MKAFCSSDLKKELTVTCINKIQTGPGNKVEGDVRDLVSLQAQTSPYFQLREKFKCIENVAESETQLKTSP